ncbi:MAG: zinc metallopeptidase [Firmicutes bacterium]|nr:zinc metallopeptidase [Bacillota bacterium]
MYAGLIPLILAMILATMASARVQSTFQKYSQVRAMRGLTGAQAARLVLDANGLNNVPIQKIAGSMTDNYDPRSNTLHLSQTVCDVPSVSAIAVACHEAGHAIQHARGYAPVRIRNSIVPVASVASSMSWLLVIGGILLTSMGTVQYGNLGVTLFNIGIVAFLAVVVFHLVTLPVEFDASNRAISSMEALGISSGEELKSVKQVLSSAALTYVAALAVSVANLLRVLSMRGNRR